VEVHLLVVKCTRNGMLQSHIQAHFAVVKGGEYIGKSKAYEWVQLTSCFFVFFCNCLMMYVDVARLACRVRYCPSVSTWQLVWSIVCGDARWDHSQWNLGVGVKKAIQAQIWQQKHCSVLGASSSL